MSFGEPLRPHLLVLFDRGDRGGVPLPKRRHGGEPVKVARLMRACRLIDRGAADVR